MKERIKFSAKVTGITILFCIAALFVMGIGIAITGKGTETMNMMNPLISGYLHNGLPHFLLNMVLIFLALLAPINSSYDQYKIFWVTTIISFIYFPVELLGITLPAVGISGTCYYLLARYFFTWENKKNLGKAIILILAAAELFAIAENDGAAHGVHLIGILFGYLSLKKPLEEALSNLPLPKTAKVA